MSVELEREPMVIDDDLYREFQQRYGLARAPRLVIFYTQVKLYKDDRIIRTLYSQRTYYELRRTLVLDKYLSIEEFESIGGGDAYLL